MLTASTARTFLFVPGDRPDRFQKAAKAGADAVILGQYSVTAVDPRRAVSPSWCAGGEEVVI
jgi:citrate lyase subunit beta / citryl-CoA lyase